MDEEEYTKDELNDIFDTINSRHFKLKGRQKSITKRQFTTTWKRDSKSIGAFELAIFLYKSEDLYDESNEWLRNHLAENNLSPNECKTKKAIPYAKYIKRIRMKDEQINELTIDNENMLEDNNLITKEEHNDILYQQSQLKDNQNKQLKDDLQKAQNELHHKDSDCRRKIETALGKALYFEKLHKDYLKKHPLTDS